MGISPPAVATKVGELWVCPNIAVKTKMNANVNRIF
jgi:hypothetical protein